MSQLTEDMGRLADEWGWPWPPTQAQHRLLALSVIYKDTGDSLHGGSFSKGSSLQGG